MSSREPILRSGPPEGGAHDGERGARASHGPRGGVHNGDPNERDAPASHGPRGGAPAGLPRLLAGIPARGALGLGKHLALHGELSMLEGRHRHASAALIELLEQAALRGRGGAGFPTAAKLRAVAERRSPLGGRPIVVVNAAEAEPASAKDRTLLRSLPHLVLDGALLAAAAVGAQEILLGVRRPTSDRYAAGALDTTALAISERGQPRRGQPSVQVVAVPDRYVAGQESALVNYLGGGPALPTFTPPRPFERGVRGRPTLVCNVETLAHIALIARHGADWFRELGTPLQPGSALVTLSGPVAHPGVYEIEYGSPLSALLDAADGATAQPRAVLLGGYCGAWIDARGMGSDFRGVALSDAHLAPHGATLGAGVVTLLSTDACPVAELARITRWLAAQSARQCGPCVFGLDAIATVFEQLVFGGAGDGRALQGPPAVISRLHSLARLVNGRGACSHPDGAARLLASALQVFAEELTDHARHGPCAACGRPSELPQPRATVPGRGPPQGRRRKRTPTPLAIGR